jgi:DtxR family Mn-dependent transcriptional regulator
MKRKTVERYIEVIYLLQAEKEYAHTTDIANEMSVKPSSVTEMLQKLGTDGFIEYHCYKGARLTKKGAKIANQLEIKHHALSEFLLMLNVDKKNAERDACEIEHHVSDETIGRILEFVNVLKRDRYRGLRKGEM